MITASNIIFSGVVKQKYPTTLVLAYKAAKKANNQHARDQETAIDAIAASCVRFDCSIEFKKTAILVVLIKRAT